MILHLEPVQQDIMVCITVPLKQEVRALHQLLICSYPRYADIC